MSPRTIIVSDLHGFDALLENALADAGFGASDRLVVAGDLVDIGPDDCIATARSHGALILAGNHEVSAALGVEIYPQNTETPSRAAEFAEEFLSGEWPLAVAVDGWLVTHGGVSTLLGDEIARAHGDAEALAGELNSAFVREMRLYLNERVADDLTGSPILGSPLGPLWFRAGRRELVPDGLAQIAGHTPCEFFSADGLAMLASKRFLLTDPGAHLESNPRRRCRYAVVEDGTARIVNACP